MRSVSAERTAPLTIAGPPDLRGRLMAAMENFFPGSTNVQRRFAIDIRELEPRVTHDVDGIEVTPYVVKHSCGAPPFALRVTEDGRRCATRAIPNGVESLRAAAEGADLLSLRPTFSSSTSSSVSITRHSLGICPNSAPRAWW